MLPNLNGDVNSLAYLFCMSLPIVFMLPRQGLCTSIASYYCMVGIHRATRVHAPARGSSYTAPYTAHDTCHDTPPPNPIPSPAHTSACPHGAPTHRPPRALCSNTLNAVHPPHLPRAFCCLFDPLPIVLASVYILSTSNSKLTIPKEGYLQNPPDQNYQPTEGSIQPPIITPATRL